MAHEHRWWLATAWALIATAGVMGVRKISGIPPVDPDIRVQTERLREQMARGPVDPVPEDVSLARFAKGWSFGAVGVSPHPFAATLLPRGLGSARTRERVDVRVQPLFATPRAEASLGGVTLTWTVQTGTVDLEAHERAEAVPPPGLKVWRKAGEWKIVAQLEAKATSWKDVEAEPRTSYAYRVSLDAPEKARTAKDGPAVEVRTPTDRRVRLTGGDAKVALLRVETYNRKSGMWTGRDRTARPGDELWPGGWRLTGLAFQGFVLAAEVLTEDGRAVELTTRD